MIRFVDDLARDWKQFVVLVAVFALVAWGVCWLTDHLAIRIPVIAVAGFLLWRLWRLWLWSVAKNEEDDDFYDYQ